MCDIHVHLQTSSGRQQLAAHAHLHVAALPPAEQSMGHAAGGKQHPSHPAACRTALGAPQCPNNIGVQLRKAVGSRKKSSMRAFYFILFLFWFNGLFLMHCCWLHGSPQQWETPGLHQGQLPHISGDARRLPPSRGLSLSGTGKFAPRGNSKFLHLPFLWADELSGR